MPGRSNRAQSPKVEKDCEQSLRLAEQCNTQGRFEAARLHCLAALKSNPENFDALRLLAQAEARAGRMVAANKTADRLGRLDPDSSDRLRLLGDLQTMDRTWLQHPYARNYRAERMVHMDYPRNIAIETVGRCNATCSFCPHNQLDRRFTAMSESLFEKILDDLSAIQPEVPTRIFPNIVNEPFMDKSLFERLRRINEVLPKTALLLFTNFNVLPKDFPDKLRGIANLEEINVSFNAATQEEYEAVMGIDFDRTVGHLKRLMAENREARFLAQPIVLSRVSDGTSRDQSFAEDCRALFGGYEDGADYVSHVKARTNWLGAMHDSQSPIPHALPCSAWLDINVTCTGIVPLCCMDANLEHSIGDANTTNLLEIYNSPAFRGLRESETAREALDPCGSCSLLQ